VDEQSAFTAECSELSGVAEPGSGARFRRGSGIDDAAMDDFPMESISENNPTPNAHRETDTQASHANPDVSPASSIPSPCLQNFRILSHEKLHKSLGINMTFRKPPLSQELASGRDRSRCVVLMQSRAQLFMRNVLVILDAKPSGSQPECNAQSVQVSADDEAALEVLLRYSLNPKLLPLARFFNALLRAYVNREGFLIVFADAGMMPLSWIRVYV
jgi:hypothetical protein